MKHIVFEFYEICPECGKEAHGFCNENLAGICNHCGSEIVICNQCPVTCGCTHCYKKDHDYCESCPYRFLDCEKVDCSNCIAKMKKTVVEPNRDNDYTYITVSDKSLMLKGKDE